MRVLILCLWCASCRCSPLATQVEVEPLFFDHTALNFEPTYLGSSRTQVLEVTNRSRVEQIAAVGIEAPFSIADSTLRVAPGATVPLEVQFSPTVAGEASGTLTLDAMEVPVAGVGLEVPACISADPCEESRFDTSQAQCLATPLAEGSACVQQCVVGGRCLGGSCVGGPVDCGDADACTVDACGPSGCTHQERTCPVPTNPCKVAACDSTSGCAETDADDGTVCGPDRCVDAQVSVCIAGACVQRARPQLERCTNTWVSTFIPTSPAKLAYDPRLRVTIAVVGRQTWAWDGSSWAQRYPPAVPPALRGATLVTDPHRNRLVLFGGLTGAYTYSNETWEWDGVTWLRRSTTLTPPARAFAAAAYDTRRRRTVLFGGANGTSRLADTWEWNGVRWEQAASPSTPSPRAYASVAYDPVRERAVLFGGNDADGNELGDTWEWDGTSWSARPMPTAPRARSGATLTWDAARQMLTLVGGLNYDPLPELWDFDGTTWTQRTAATPAVAGHAASWDSARQRLVMLASGNTWEWDGTTWADRRQRAPPQRMNGAAVLDAARHRLVSFAGYNALASNASYNDTWLWDGSSWSEASPTVVPGTRYLPGLAWDSSRARVVMAGGSSLVNTPGGSIGQDWDDTWEWDGASWTALTVPPPRPSGFVIAAAFDVRRNRTVLMNSQGTWEFDGTRWAQLADAAQTQADYKTALVFHPPQQVLAVRGSVTRLWNGSVWTTLAPATPLPLGLDRGALGFDPLRQRTLLLSPGPVPGTWSWDGATWTNLSPSMLPTQFGKSLVFDDVSGHLTLLTGSEQWVYLP